MITEKVKAKLLKLKMKAAAENLEQVIAIAQKKNWSVLEISDHLLEIELESKRTNRIGRLLRESKLTQKLTIDQFDFNFHKSRKKLKTLILNLIDAEFVRQRKDIILIGNPGVGKSFLAKCIAYAAIQASIKTLFTTAMDMINNLIAAEADYSLLKKLSYYQSPDLLVCDELCKALHNSSYGKLNVM